MNDEMPLYIWWLNADDQDNIGYVLLEFIKAPEYLQSEYNSLRGRPRRGRLWCAPELDDQFQKLTGGDSIKWDESKADPLNLDLCGGIVIAPDELGMCALLPGVVTDLELNKIEKPVRPLIVTLTWEELP